MSKIDESLLPTRYQPDGSNEEGGYSDITYCTDLHLERKVAVKTIQEISESGRLRDEINSLLSMRSKNVIQVFDLVKSESEVVGIVLEYIDGVNLLDSEYPQVSAENYLKTLWQLACGISDIHDKGIIHRDITPNNIKLDSEGVLKIFDFGLSRESENDAATRGFRGTLAYAAPELYVSRDVNVEFTTAVDVYAFGVIALKLLNTDLPDEVRAFPPRPLTASPYPEAFRNDFPDLVSLLMDCLNSNPISRPHIHQIRNEMARHLLKDKHQALAVMNNQAYYISHSNKKASLSVPNQGSFEIYYDGLCFYLDNITGSVLMNSSLVTNKTELVDSCVVAIGLSYPMIRYITFDVSSPEVTL